MPNNSNGTSFEDHVLQRVASVENKTSDNSERISKLEMIADFQVKLDADRDKKLENIEKSLALLVQAKDRGMGYFLGVTGLGTLLLAIGGLIGKYIFQ